MSIMRCRDHTPKRTTRAYAGAVVRAKQQPPFNRREQQERALSPLQSLSRTPHSFRGKAIRVLDYQMFTREFDQPRSD